MGVIKRGLIFFVGILLLVSLLFGNLFLTFAISTNYENIKSEATPAIRAAILGDGKLGKQIEYSINNSTLQCKNNSVVNFSDLDLDIKTEIPCEVLKQGKEQVVNYTTDKIIEDIYYRDYECSFTDCFKKEGAIFLVSEHAKNYWMGKFYLFLTISILIILGAFFLFEEKSNYLLFTGSMCIVSSLPLIKLDWIMNIFIGTIASSMNLASSLKLTNNSSLVGLFSIFFSESVRVFWIFFILGLGIIVVGLIFKFWNFEEGIFKREDKGKKI